MSRFGANSTIAPWQAAVARAAYEATATLLAPAAMPLLALHPRLSGGLRQRLGLQHGQPPLQRPVWLHGSSAGDVAALVPLATRLADLGLPLALSAWTASGFQMARLRAEQLDLPATVFHAPLDLPGPVGAVLDRLQPGCLVLECLELWPTLVGSCQRRRIPVAVVNGRLSPSSLGHYRRLRWLFEPCFAALSRVSALTPEDAARFVAAGTPAGRVSVLSSSKHGGLVGAAAPECKDHIDQPAKVVLGSLHQQEEQLLFPRIPRLLEAVPGLRLVVAPRYPHRAGAVVRRLGALGVAASLWSVSSDMEVQVLDRMGPLAEQYVGARAAFVGGSLVKRGCHNVMEPAARGVPVLTGPHTDNVRQELRMLLEAGAATVVQDGPSFARQLLELLGQPQQWQARSQAALAVAARLAHAADQLAEMILELHQQPVVRR